MTDLAADLAELDAQIRVTRHGYDQALEAAHQPECDWYLFELGRLSNLRRIRVDMGETP